MKMAVYGTLKRGFWNNILIKDQQFEGTQFVKCYGITWSGFPIANFKKTEWVDPILLEVEVFNITDQKIIDQVDRLEGHPTRYERIVVTTEEWNKVEIYTQDVTEIDATNLINIEDNKYARKLLSINKQQCQ